MQTAQTRVQQEKSHPLSPAFFGHADKAKLSPRTGQGVRVVAAQRPEGILEGEFACALHAVLRPQEHKVGDASPFAQELFCFKGPDSGELLAQEVQEQIFLAGLGGMGCGGDFTQGGWRRIIGQVAGDVPLVQAHNS